MYNALKWKSKGYLDFRVGVLAKEIQALKESGAEESLVKEYQNMRLKELQQEYLENTDAGYKLLLNLSERTAEAMEQAFSDYFFDLMTNKFDTWRDRLYNLLLSMQRIVSNVLGQIAADWLRAGAKKLLDMKQSTIAASGKVAALLKEQLATAALGTAQAAQAVSVQALAAAYWGLAAAKAAAGMGGGAGGMSYNPLDWATTLFSKGGLVKKFAGGGEVPGCWPLVVGWWLLSLGCRLLVLDRW